MKTIIILSTLLLSCACYADTLTGKITGFIPFSSGENEIIIFKLNNSVPGGCNTTARFAMDSTTPRYEATLAAVLSAFHAQSNVKVHYSSSCDAWSNSADVHFICIGTINC